MQGLREGLRRTENIHTHRIWREIRPGRDVRGFCGFSVARVTVYFQGFDKIRNEGPNSSGLQLIQHEVKFQFRMKYLSIRMAIIFTLICIQNDVSK